METLRALPSVHELIEQPQGQRLVREHGRPLVLFAIQQALDRERAAGSPVGADARWSTIQALVGELRDPRLRRVINATGVVLHTNLGRAPLSPQAARAAADIATGYSNLELDLGTGRRGTRHDLVSHLLCHLSGAEAAAVVNNCAAATLLMLTALTRGREVVVSRGELVEIGGAFRMPDIMRLSGARMVEVGTTNRTRVEDYEQAIGPRTAALLKVHASNFQVVGFTESVDLRALAGLAHRHGLWLLHDLGSGALLDTGRYGLGTEPQIAESIQAGVDLVVCSGDKLLGGPQAGLLFGRADLVARALKHSLARAVRVDKLTLAALAATLDHYLTQSRPALPVWEMLEVTADRLATRARNWATRLAAEGVAAELRPGTSTVGGGSLPGETLPTTLVVLPPQGSGSASHINSRISAGGSSARLLRRLRAQEPPVIARIQDDRVVLDPRTVLPGDEDALLRAVISALR